MRRKKFGIKSKLIHTDIKLSNFLDKEDEHNQIIITSIMFAFFLFEYYYILQCLFLVMV
ncbi:hypothetical protein Xish_03646 [Xenorhabdus ishibashii]|uniref:Uncharacterized protein n=1 Tax=Xenorhabdus ishibashii TaxID=1034471 RepID=A0A2D0K8J0_9GAMM|nr:hypothetical protein Xish_03646 [Xenorhabdus ishibashii]